MSYNDKAIDTKIGAVDLETYSSDENGIGNLEVYAGGIALNGGYKQIYYLDSQKGLISGNDLIQKMFKELFDYIC